jgi:hypothetical protein
MRNKGNTIMIELSLTLLIIGAGIGFWIADMRATRKWQNEAMARNAFLSIRH